MIVLMAGLPGTGKTTLARELARVTGGALVSKDEIRAALFAPEDIEYSVVQDDFVMEVMLDNARYLLRKMPDEPYFWMAAPSPVVIKSSASLSTRRNCRSRGRSSNAPARMTPLAVVSTRNPILPILRKIETSNFTSK